MSDIHTAALLETILERLTEIRDRLPRPVEHQPIPTELAPGNASIFGYVTGQTAPPRRHQVACADAWVERASAGGMPHLAIESNLVMEILSRRDEATA